MNSLLKLTLVAALALVSTNAYACDCQCGHDGKACGSEKVEPKKSSTETSKVIQPATEARAQLAVSSDKKSKVKALGRHGTSAMARERILKNEQE